MINWPEILRREEDSADNQNDEGVRVLVGISSCGSTRDSISHIRADAGRHPPDV